MSNDLLTVAVVAWLLGRAHCPHRRGLPLLRGLLVLGSVAGIIAAIMALPDGTIAVESADTACRRAGHLSDRAGSRLASRLRSHACRARLRAGDAGGARPSRLAIRRRHEPRRGPRCFRVTRWRQLSDRLGDHELRRRGDDPLREIIARRPAGIIHARSSRSRRDCAYRGDSAPRAQAATPLHSQASPAGRPISPLPLRRPLPCCSLSASAPSSGYCRSTNGSRPLMAPAAARPAR